MNITTFEQTCEHMKIPSCHIPNIEIKLAIESCAGLGCDAQIHKDLSGFIMPIRFTENGKMTFYCRFKKRKTQKQSD